MKLELEKEGVSVNGHLETNAVVKQVIKTVLNERVWIEQYVSYYL